MAHWLTSLSITQATSIAAIVISCFSLFISWRTQRRREVGRLKIIVYGSDPQHDEISVCIQNCGTKTLQVSSGGLGRRSSWHPFHKRLVFGTFTPKPTIQEGHDQSCRLRIPHTKSRSAIPDGANAVWVETGSGVVFWCNNANAKEVIQSLRDGVPALQLSPSRELVDHSEAAYAHRKQIARIAKRISDK